MRDALAAPLMIVSARVLHPVPLLRKVQQADESPAIVVDRVGSGDRPALAPLILQQFEGQLIEVTDRLFAFAFGVVVSEKLEKVVTLRTDLAEHIIGGLVLAALPFGRAREFKVLGDAIGE